MFVFGYRRKEADSPVIARQAESEEESLSGSAAEFNLTAMSPDDALDDEESESVPIFSCREIRLEDFIGHLWVDPTAVITDANPDVGVVTSGCHTQFSFRAHGLKTITNHIVKSLPDLISVDSYRREFF